MVSLLITCKNMINRLDVYREVIDQNGIEFYCPEFDQVMSEEELIELVPQYDVWVIGDDPCTRKVLEAGIAGNLKFAVKWGIGTDNVDFDACRDLNFPIPNTPGMFNEEVSNVALGYLLTLAHNLVWIDQESRKGVWYKPLGTSLEGKKAAVIGFGNIGRSLVRKLLSLKMDVWAYDPGFRQENGKILCNYNENLIVDPELHKARLDNDLNSVLSNADAVLLVCALTESSHHLINKSTLSLVNDGCFLVNVARGKVVKQDDLAEALKSGKVGSAALDVFEEEPLDSTSELYNLKCIFGAHNSSNTKEGVDRTSFDVLNKIITFFDNKL